MATGQLVSSGIQQNTGVTVNKESKPERISPRLIAAWIRLDEVLQQEHEAKAAMIVCVGKNGEVWSLFSPALDSADQEELLTTLRAGLA